MENNDIEEKEHNTVKLNQNLKGRAATTTTTNRKPGGWKSMPFILGNETLERMASMGVGANFAEFLEKKFNKDQVTASNIINIWSGCTNFSPLFGAYISDAFLGRFSTIAFSSFFTLFGLGTLTLIVSIPGLHPPQCTAEQTRLDQCKEPTKSQMGVLITALGLLAIGAGGIKPCSIPFGVDQFDTTTEQGRKAINSFFNWYYTTLMVVLIIIQTLLVYIESKSWIWGYGILTFLMLGSIILFFVGMKFYVYVKPVGSIFSGIAQVFISAYKKRKLHIPDHGHKEFSDDSVHVFYDKPLNETETNSKVTKLHLTNHYRCLNKAAIIMEGEVKGDGSEWNKWRLCSVQQIEEVKCLLKVMPVWASGIICLTAVSQQGTFSVFQAEKMDLHLRPNYKIPPASIQVITMITVSIWLPFYDRILVPFIRNYTKIEAGITILQRMGVGLVFSILSMVTAGVIERKRQNLALLHGGIAPMTVMWLAPQFILIGLAEAFNFTGQIEFYYKEFPENMRSVGGSLFSVSWGCAAYLSTAVVTVVHKFTGGKGRQPWLAKNINDGRTDYFYYLLAAMGVLNFIYFLTVASGYRYKSIMYITTEATTKDDDDDDDDPVDV